MRNVTIFLLAILWSAPTFLNAQTFINGNFEDVDSSCEPLSCFQSLDPCATGWIAFLNDPSLANFDESCQYVICEGKNSMILRRGDGTQTTLAATDNPLFGTVQTGAFAITADFYIHENSEVGGVLNVYGSHGTGLTLLGQSECIAPENVCKSIEVLLDPSASDYELLVFGVDDCGGGLTDLLIPVVEGVVDNLGVCQQYELVITTPNCGQVCFELVENNCNSTQSLLNPTAVAWITFSDGTELFVESGEGPECAYFAPGTTVTYTVEYYIFDDLGNYIGMYTDTGTWTQPDPQVTAGFIIVDDEGNEKTTFCTGEPIYFQNTNTNDETEWFIQICMRDIGDPTSNFPCNGWTSNQINGQWIQGEVPDTPIDLLTEVWQLHHPDWDFWPGQQYTVGLAVRNLPCEGWVDHYVTFIVEDCVVDVINYTITPIDECTYCFEPNITVSDCIEYTQYYWDFGDGNTSTEWSPCHSYDANGNYNVTFNLEGYSSDPQGTPAPIACSFDYFGSLVCPHECEPACECKISNAGIDILSSSGCWLAAYPEVAVGNECTQITQYTWTWGDGSLPTTSSGPAPAYHTYSSSGWFYVCLTVTGTHIETGTTCSQTFCQWVQIRCAVDAGSPDDPVFFQLEDRSPGLAVYPNPVSDQLFVELTDYSEHTQLQLSIYDATGREMIRQPYPVSGAIDVRNLSEGLYFLRVSDGEGYQQQQKIIVQH